jgi:hypothetical protein
VSGVLAFPEPPVPLDLPGVPKGTKIPATNENDVDDADVNVIVSPDDPDTVAADAVKKSLVDDEADLDAEFNKNLAIELAKSPEGLAALRVLEQDLLEAIEQDENSRRDWSDTAAKAVTYLGVKIEEMSLTAAEGSVTKVWSNLLMKAAIGFWAMAQAELLPSNGPVKVRNDAADPTEDQVERAKRFEKDANHFFTTTDVQYYPDTSRMLMSLGPIGTQFKAVHRCPDRHMPVCEWVNADDLIVSSDAAHLWTARRITQRSRKFPSEIRSLIRRKVWRQYDPQTNAEMATPYQKAVGEAEGVKQQPGLRTEDNRNEILLCQTKVDLARTQFAHKKGGEETGEPLPYRVTIDRTSREVVDIRRIWRRKDERMRPRQRYVMYGLIPGLGFYNYGHIHTIGNDHYAATLIERVMLDGGIFSCFPGLLKAKGGSSRQDSSEMIVGPGRAKEIDTGGQDIRSVVMPMPFKEPGPVMLEMLKDIMQQAEEKVGAANTPVGEGTADIPVGTIMAIVLEATKVLSAVHKGLHRSQAEEFRLWRELLMEDMSVLTLDNPRAYDWSDPTDIEDMDLVPASDPNTPSQVFRVMQAVASVQFAQMFPGVFNMPELLHQARSAMGMADSPNIWAPPPDPGQQPQIPQDPNKMAALQVKLQEAERKAATAMANVQGGIEKARIAAQAQTEVANIEREIETLKLAHAHDQANQDRAHQGAQDAVSHLHERGMADDTRAHEQQQSAQDAALQRENMQQQAAATEQRDAHKFGFPPMTAPAGPGGH